MTDVVTRFVATTSDRTVVLVDGAASVSDITFDEAKQLDPTLRTLRDDLGDLAASDAFVVLEADEVADPIAVADEALAVLDPTSFVLASRHAPQLRALRASSRHRSVRTGLVIESYPPQALVHRAPAMIVARSKLAYSRADAIVTDRDGSRFVVADLARATGKRLVVRS